jgi:hypothetical protein
MFFHNYIFSTRIFSLDMCIFVSYHGYISILMTWMTSRTLACPKYLNIEGHYFSGK